MKNLDTFGKSFLSSWVFIDRAYKTFNNLTKGELRRRNGTTNRLIGEVLPLATFLKYFMVPGRIIRCRHYSGSQNFDARIKLSGNEVDQGFFQPHYYVEVTQAMRSDSHLIREALDRYGFACLSGRTKRIGSRHKGNDRIETTEEVRDHGDGVKDAIGWIINALKQKNGKDYPSPCLLLIAVSDGMFFTLQDWANVCQGVRNQLDRDQFAATYIVNSWTDMVASI